MGGRKNGTKGGAADVANLTLEVLRGLRRDLQEGFAALRVESRATNERLDETNRRLDETNGRLGRLEQRQTESEVRLATELIAVAKALGDVKTLLEVRLELHDRVEVHEHRLKAVEKKLGIES